MHMVPVTKDEEQEQPVPSIWRDAFREVATAFSEGDFTLDRGVRWVSPISNEDAGHFARYVADYGCTLTSLSDETWQTSVCQWLETHWEVLVDLFTVEEGMSDLVLFANVFEDGDEFRIEIFSVHVP